MSKVKKFDALGRFTGSFQDLKKHFRNYKGNWKAVGPAKQYHDRIWNEDITWWPDTGDFCHRHYPLDDWDLRPFPDKLRALLSRKPTKWKKSRNGISLPQMFFKNPLRFMTDYFENGDLRNDPEYEEIYLKSISIKIPGIKSAENSIVHRFSPRNEYLGFEITALDVPIRRFSGSEFVDDQIDTSLLHYELRNNGSPGGEILARCLMNVFDDVQPRLWDRKGCEEFFNYPANFHS